MQVFARSTQISIGGHFSLNGSAPAVRESSPQGEISCPPTSSGIPLSSRRTSLQRYEHLRIELVGEAPTPFRRLGSAIESEKSAVASVR